ncbi:putative toxin-antitoxin system toxin component, PIN family [Treponema sp. OMZ 787]|uniref:putative toxin-antitoxin system toxin component, PIN family n=1 Tax=Treponema sp. OMZ 787 TaxID=2563669 RepID=UPI0020A2DE5F|nr:putative toxin-antitoxin system toxin component, PIN family [Treponema sp. OMZ 787]UTC62313.1 putative toxin-antitoxin system toxin component, PIN family [Treponema sp. OMZ 787]
MKSMQHEKENRVPLYAVIDTNVLVSAFLKENSIPRFVINYMYAGKIIPIYNEEIISEYFAVLSRPKFCFPKEAVNIAVNAIQKIGLKMDGINVEETIPDPKDIVFYAVTLDARQRFESYLITGNTKHFPAKTFVLTPRQILDIVERLNL